MKAVTSFYMTTSEGIGSLRRTLSRPSNITTGIGNLGRSVSSNVSNSLARLERGLHGYSDEAERAMQRASEATGGAYEAGAYESALDPMHVTARPPPTRPPVSAEAGDGAIDGAVDAAAVAIDVADTAGTPLVAAAGGAELSGGEFVASLQAMDDRGVYSPPPGSPPPDPSTIPVEADSTFYGAQSSASGHDAPTPAASSHSDTVTSALLRPLSPRSDATQ